MTHGTGVRRQKEEKLLSCWDYWLRQVEGGWISSAHGRCMGLEWKTLSSSFGHADGSELSKESCLRDTWTGTQGKLLQRQWDTSARSSAGSNSSCARAGDSPSSWPTLGHWTKGAPPRGSHLQWTCSPKAQGLLLEKRNYFLMPGRQLLAVQCYKVSPGQLPEACGRVGWIQAGQTQPMLF